LLLAYAADMHGSERVWRKFVNGAKYFGTDVLILGGDITGKILVPVVEEKPGVHRARVFGKVETAKGQRRLEELEEQLRFNGYYPYRCSPEEYEHVANDEAYRMGVMKQLMVATAARWAQIADEKLQGTDVMIYGMAGNDDEQEIDDALHGEHLTNVEGAVVRVGDYQMLSSAWSNPTPWDTPRELEEPALLELFRSLASKLEPDRPTIFNLHLPPYDSGLDTGPEVIGVDAQGQITVKMLGGSPSQVPVGSKAVRTLIEEYQPVLGLHSHIHESKGTCKIGRTLCINPGSNYQDGVLDAAIVELKGDEVVQYQLVSG
jgi:Icc-related predicted phosphoesterase